MDFDTHGSAPNRSALLCTTDPVVRTDALRVAAAASCVVLEQEFLDGTAAASGAASAIRLIWNDAVVVMIDVDTAHRALDLRLPRRDGVVVLARETATVDHWQAATAVGASAVLELPRDEEQLIRLLGRRHDTVRGNGGVITLVGARGGAGASTLAAALALTASAEGDRTLLVDGDKYGGGLDLLLGWEDSPGLRWSGLVVEAGRISGEALHGALPSNGMLSVLSAGRALPDASPGGFDTVASAAVVEAGRCAGDLVVCDVPRFPGKHSDVFHDAADLIVLVVPAELGAVAAAENLACHLMLRNSNVGLVVRGPAPGGLSGGQIAEALRMPLLAVMRPEPGLARRVERGGLRLGKRSPLGAAAASILDTFARKPHTRSAAA